MLPWIDGDSSFCTHSCACRVENSSFRPKISKFFTSIVCGCAEEEFVLAEKASGV